MTSSWGDFSLTPQTICETVPALQGRATHCACHRYLVVTP